MIRQTPSLVFFIFCGHLVGAAVFNVTSDAMIALLAACVATSYLQRFMRITGEHKQRGSHAEQNKGEDS